MIVTVAPTGPLTSRQQHPRLPLTPQEIGIAVAEAAEAGAAVAHIHARDEEGRPTADPNVFAAIVGEIDSRCDIVIQASTGVGLDVMPEERLRILDDRVDVPMATLNPASMTFGTTTFANPPDFVERLARRIQERGIRPELEVYDFGHVRLCLDLVAAGLISGPLHFSFVMGVRGGVPADPGLLPYLVEMLPAGATWQVIGIGRGQLPLTLAGLALGGNIRVGFEDNVMWAHGELADSNAQLVSRTVELCRLAGRRTASPDDVRATLS